MTKVDVHSATWKIIRRTTLARIAELQTDLEEDLDEARTARIRGAISELRAFLETHDPAPQQEPEETTGEGSIYS